MIIDIARALDILRPGALWFGSVTDGTQTQYDAIRWEDVTVKPTWEELMVEFFNSEQQAKVDYVNVKRDEILFGDVPYIFPGDTEPDHIQFRDEMDRQNIQDQVIVASAEVALGNTTITNVFMPLSNTPKYVTVSDMVAIGRHLKARGERIFMASWDHKAILRSYTIEQQDLLTNYDFDAGWPPEELNT